MEEMTDNVLNWKVLKFDWILEIYFMRFTYIVKKVNSKSNYNVFIFVYFIVLPRGH